EFLIEAKNAPSLYSKVELEDGTVGWMLSEHIKILHNPVFQEEQDTQSQWNMARANSRNNPVFFGPVIKQPQVATVFQNYPNSGLRFYDVNGDGVLEFLVRQSATPASGRTEIHAKDGRTYETL
ncbi:hypothetical protein L0244_01035, partial [bacterium]|nr:hypothetical protein [bacterium]